MRGKVVRSAKQKGVTGRLRSKVLHADPQGSLGVTARSGDEALAALEHKFISFFLLVCVVWFS